MTLAHFGWCTLISTCFTLGVHPADDISYDYWDMGVSLSDQDSKYLSNDLNFFGDINVSKSVYRNSSQDKQFGVHFWADFTQSRDLSDDSAYKLSLLRTFAGLGLHYSTETISTYFRLGKGSSAAKFKTTSTRPSRPVVIGGGGGDIFAPPISIFDSNRPPSQTTYTNEENGTVGKIGIRYRLSEQYQIGASVQRTDMDSCRTELSAYIQRDFENSPFNANTTFSPLGGGVMSLKVEATTDNTKSSVGLSLVYSF